MHNPCRYIHAIFKTLAYLEPDVPSKACRTYKACQSLSTLAYSEQFLQAFSRILRIFRDIDACSATLTSAELRGEERLPLLFLKIEKGVLILE